MDEERQEFKKYQQFIRGQFRKTSKKAQALFIGRSIQLLSDSVMQFMESKKLRMDTLRFMVDTDPLPGPEETIIDGWVLITVAYEIGSEDPFTEEDRKQIEEARKQAEERLREQEKESGPAAMEELEKMVYMPPAEAKIQ